MRSGLEPLLLGGSWPPVLAGPGLDWLQSRVEVSVVPDQPGLLLAPPDQGAGPCDPPGLFTTVVLDENQADRQPELDQNQGFKAKRCRLNQLRWA